MGALAIDMNKRVKYRKRDGWAWCDVCGKLEFLSKWYHLNTVFPCGDKRCNGQLTTKDP